MTEPQNAQDIRTRAIVLESLIFDTFDPDEHFSPHVDMWATLGDQCGSDDLAETVYALLEKAYDLGWRMAKSEP